jgi:ADP-ribose pyrophosphatase YjhB (NUDIX family)
MAVDGSPAIRPVALAILRRGDDILVFEGRDETKRETFYRPLGGGIEFGEPAAEAVRRELREELGVELTSVELLGVLENIFTAFGRPHHEIVFVYAAEAAEPAVYTASYAANVLDEGSPVSWQPLARFRSGGAILYPAGLIDLLRPPAVAGVVREWHSDLGWGVLDSDATPGGCWAHFSSVLMDGYRTLEEGQAVRFEFDRGRQDGFAFRAVAVWTGDDRPPAPGRDEPSAAYRSTLHLDFGPDHAG